IDEHAAHPLTSPAPTDIHPAWRRAPFIGTNIDARDAAPNVKARRWSVAAYEVHTAADHADYIGNAGCGRTTRHRPMFVIVRHEPAALRRGIERNAGLFDELLQF